MRTLFLSYDGLTDPLGQSQILPYQEGLARAGHQVCIVSAEKAAAFNKRGLAVEARVAKAGITWRHYSYTKRPPVLSTLWDIWQMRSLALALNREEAFELVHCRSYITMLIGAEMKRRFGTKLIFDLRGFWADERVDGGVWNLQNPLYRSIYQFFKRKEAQWMAQAEGIVSLTEAGARIMESWPAYKQNPNLLPRGRGITVIPCSADFDFFTAVTQAEKVEGRARLNIPTDALVVSYLGSVGTWYLLPEMLQFFKHVLAKSPDAKMLFLTPEPRAFIEAEASRQGVPAHQLIVQYAERAELNVLLAASDVSLCFIKPCFSKRSSSPTKLGELLAKGIPVIANAGVGDVAQILLEHDAGMVLPDVEAATLQAAAENLPALLERHTNPAALRAGTHGYFGLEQGVAKYVALYQQLSTQ
jgi:glycosyltransferase involved in cell wall biosynthesis